MTVRRYDLASYCGFSAYALCSLVIPVLLVAMGRDLNFPLDRGGMSWGGLLHLIRCLAMMLALMVCGAVAGRFGNRVPLGDSILLMGASIFCCAFVPGYGWLIPLMLAAGFAEGICEGLATPFVQFLHPDTPEKHVNIAHSFWSVGIGVCVLAAGALLSCEVPWRIVLAGAGLCGILASLLFLWRESPGGRYPEPRRHPGTGTFRRDSAAIFRTPRFWLYCGGMFTGAGAEFCLTFWSAAFLQLTFGAAPLTAGLGTAAIALGMFAGRNLFARIATGNNLPVILLASSLGTIPPTLALAGLNADMFAPPILFPALMILLFLCGVGIAPYWPTLQVYGVKRLPELNPTLLYIYFSAVGVPGCGFFTWLLGILGDRYQLRGALLVIPFTLFIYAAIIAVDLLSARRKRQ
ncbi:MAG: MFS transporter [Lentisphaeria bacterium]|nr:MFS transporter [Lentisphaeria bacterium]